jgi:hypothetical protein
VPPVGDDGSRGRKRPEDCDEQEEAERRGHGENGIGFGVRRMVCPFCARQRVQTPFRRWAFPLICVETSHSTDWRARVVSLLHVFGKRSMGVSTQERVVAVYQLHVEVQSRSRRSTDFRPECGISPRDGVQSTFLIPQLTSLGGRHRPQTKPPTSETVRGRRVLPPSGTGGVTTPART